MDTRDRGHSASKPLDRGLTLSAVDRPPSGPSAVAPGLIDTPLWDSFGARRETILASGARLPVGRIGRPEEVAAAVIFLMSNGFVTGAVLPIDGGAVWFDGRRGWERATSNGIDAVLATSHGRPGQRERPSPFSIYWAFSSASAPFSRSDAGTISSRAGISSSSISNAGGILVVLQPPGGDPEAPSETSVLTGQVAGVVVHRQGVAQVAGTVHRFLVERPAQAAHFTKLLRRAFRSYVTQGKTGQ